MATVKEFMDGLPSDFTTGKLTRKLAAAFVSTDEVQQIIAEEVARLETPVSRPRGLAHPGPTG